MRNQHVRGRGCSLKAAACAAMLASAALAAPGGAQAASAGGSAAVTYSFSVFDLDLNDGIDATFRMRGFGSDSRLQNEGVGRADSAYFSRSGPVTVSPDAAGGIEPALTVQAGQVTLGAAGVVPNGVFATAEAFADGSAPSLAQSADMQAFVDSFADLMVTPNTRVVLSGQVFAWGHGDIDCDCQVFAGAMAWVSGYGTHLSALVSGSGPGSFSESSSYSFTLDNLSDTRRYYSFTADAAVSVFAQSLEAAPPVSTPIPEPATYALMLAGIALTFGATRRKRGADAAEGTHRRF